jgi:hypothetical protein
LGAVLDEGYDWVVVDPCELLDAAQVVETFEGYVEELHALLGFPDHGLELDVEGLQLVVHVLVVEA